MCVEPPGDGGRGHWVGGRGGEQGGVGERRLKELCIASVASSDSVCLQQMAQTQLECKIMDFFQKPNSHVGNHRFEFVLWYQQHTCECKGIKWKVFYHIHTLTYIFHNHNVFHVCLLTCKRPHRLIKPVILSLHWRNKQDRLNRGYYYPELPLGVWRFTVKTTETRWSTNKPKTTKRPV